MLTLIGIAGFAIAIIIFFNILSTSESIKRGEFRSSRTPHPGERPRMDPKRAFEKKSDGQPRPRICPVCGTMLDPEDYLIAALEPEPDTGRRRQAQIYGCPYCVQTGGVNLSLNGSRKLEKIEM